MSMAEFLKDSQLTTAIEDLIDKADEFLCLISPYIKLHDRIKDRLRLQKNNPVFTSLLFLAKTKKMFRKVYQKTILIF